MSMMDATHAYAIPGESSIIDVIDPSTGLTWIQGHTADQVLERHPTAILVSLAEWTRQRASEQDTPITWEPSTREQYHEMLNVLPPAAWIGGAFLVGEPTDHHAGTGRPRFMAYRERHDRFYVASRPLTVQEFRAAVMEER